MKAEKYTQVECSAIVKPRGMEHASNLMTKITYMKYFYKKSPKGRTKIDYCEIGLRYFSAN